MTAWWRRPLFKRGEAVIYEEVLKALNAPSGTLVKCRIR